MNVVILLGQRVRSGTNFVGITLSMHPDVTTIPPGVSSGEFNLFRDNSIPEQFKKTGKTSFGLSLTDEDYSLLLKEYGNNWVKVIAKKYNLSETATIFIKSPFITHYFLWRRAFPDSPIALICRDGRDNVISSIKASNDKRSWHTLAISAKKRFNYYLGRSFKNHTKDWARTARIFLAITEDEQTQKFKYEDLNNSKEEIARLLSFYKLSVNEYILEKCVNAPVMGSSYGINKNGMVKPNWKPMKKTDKFVFSGKWHNWRSFKKKIFKILAGRELIALGYENDNRW